MSVINGWTLYAHPLFLDQLERLTGAVERAAQRNPDGYATSADAKLLAALRRLMLEVIPGDPTRPEFRQGGTLGPDRKHWFRAKFGGGRFRLFFRSSTRAKIIIYAWVNDRNTLRTYGAKSDAYAVFKSMLDRGNPPEGWAELVVERRSLPGLWPHLDPPRRRRLENGNLCSSLPHFQTGTTFNLAVRNRIRADPLRPAPKP